MHHHLFYQIYGKGTPISLPQLDLLPFYDLSFDTFLTFFKVDSNLFFDFLISNVTKYYYNFIRTTQLSPTNKKNKNLLPNNYVYFYKCENNLLKPLKK